MIHVILDTNIWLYIANNSINNFKGEKHLELFNRLKSYQELGYITLYVNEIIIQEWNRNQHAQKEYIEKLKHKQKAKSELSALEKIIGDTEALKIVKKEFADKINFLIQENEKHLTIVKTFISNCRNVPIMENHKLKTIDLAMHNRAPFHKNKNNVNDTLIMLSFDSYMSNLSLTTLDAVYLVSHNKNDFCDDKEGKDFHHEIKKILSPNLKYANYDKLWGVLDLSEELQKELNKEIKIWEEDNEKDHFYYECSKCNSYGEDWGGWGELGNSMRLIFSSEVMSKSQLYLFEKEEYKPKINTQKEGSWGECNICGSTYFMCPICYNDIEFGEDYCSVCETSFSLKNKDGSYILYVQDVR